MSKKSLIKSTGIIGFATATSRVLGFVRDIVIARFFGTAIFAQAFVIAFALAVLSSVYLVFRGGWPVILIGILSIVSGIFYTATRYALGYLGLGEVFVLIFFGPVAVAGTYFVQALTFSPVAVLAGLAPGLISTAILSVNNQRDMDSDKKAGKRTLAVRFGRPFAIGEYIF